jgi:hypothetical protein
VPPAKENVLRQKEEKSFGAKIRPSGPSDSDPPLGNNVHTYIIHMDIHTYVRIQLAFIEKTRLRFFNNRVCTICIDRLLRNSCQAGTAPSHISRRR